MVGCVAGRRWRRLLVFAVLDFECGEVIEVFVVGVAVLIEGVRGLGGVLFV